MDKNRIKQMIRNGEGTEFYEEWAKQFILTFKILKLIRDEKFHSIEIHFSLLLSVSGPSQ